VGRRDVTLPTEIDWWVLSAGVDRRGIQTSPGACIAVYMRTGMYVCTMPLHCLQVTLQRLTNSFICQTKRLWVRFPSQRVQYSHTSSSQTQNLITGRTNSTTLPSPPISSSRNGDHVVAKVLLAELMCSFVHVEEKPHLSMSERNHRRAGCPMWAAVLTQKQTTLILKGYNL